MKRGVGLAVTYTDQPESADLYKWQPVAAMLHASVKIFKIPYHPQGLGMVSDA